MLNKLKIFLGLKPELEDDGKTFEQYMKKLKRLRRLYSKGKKTKDPELCDEAVERMYKLCENRGRNCLPGKSICYKCIFGFNANVFKSEDRHE